MISVYAVLKDVHIYNVYIYQNMSYISTYINQDYYFAFTYYLCITVQR